MSISAVLAVVRCLYVSLSVIHLHYVKTAEDIVTLFVGLVGPTFYFLSPFGVTKFQRNTLSGGGGHQVHEGGKSLQFSLTVSLYFGNDAR